MNQLRRLRSKEHRRTLLADGHADIRAVELEPGTPATRGGAAALDVRGGDGRADVDVAGHPARLRKVDERVAVVRGPDAHGHGERREPLDAAGRVRTHRERDGDGRVDVDERRARARAGRDAHAADGDGDGAEARDAPAAERLPRVRREPVGRGGVHVRAHAERVREVEPRAAVHEHPDHGAPVWRVRRRRDVQDGDVVRPAHDERACECVRVAEAGGARGVGLREERERADEQERDERGGERDERERRAPASASSVRGR
jgi:hypothetical protein